MEANHPNGTVTLKQPRLYSKSNPGYILVRITPLVGGVLIGPDSGGEV